MLSRPNAPAGVTVGAGGWVNVKESVPFAGMIVANAGLEVRSAITVTVVSLSIVALFLSDQCHVGPRLPDVERARRSDAPDRSEGLGGRAAFAPSSVTILPPVMILLLIWKRLLAFERQ